MVTEKIKPDDMSFQVLMDNIKEGNIKIPDFQRDFVWERTQIIDLLDSVYNHYPIGSFLFWESNEDICSYRNIGNIELKEAPKGKLINYVLDGQQRITSLFASLEEAEIKIKINGKQRHKKLQIFFDLDEKEFTAKKEFDEDEETVTKFKNIWLFPRKGNYVESLIKILSAVDTGNHTESSLETWFQETFKVSKNSASAYVAILKRIGFTEHENHNIQLTYLGREYMETKAPEQVIKLLIRNIAVFEEMLEYVLEKNEVNVDQLHQFIEDNYEVGWGTPDQILYRLKWLWKLDYGKYSKDTFTLYDEKKKELQDILDEEKKVEEKTTNGENDLRLVSIKTIIDDNKMFEIFQKLTPTRQEAFKEVHAAFKNYKFSVIYIKEQPIDTVCSIFERINNSGTPLSVVDLMVAKTWSNDFNLKEKLFEFQKSLKEYKYEDISDITIIQCLSAHLQGKCQRKDILKLSKNQLRDSWEKSTEAIRKSVDFLKTHLNISNSKILPFGALLIPLSYFFYKLGNKDETNTQAKALAEWFWKACISNRFDSAVEGKAYEDIKKIDLLLDGKEAQFNYVIPIVTEQRIIEQNYSLRNAFCKTIMCIYAYKKPVHLENNKPVDFNSFSKFNAIEYHHIFPQNYLKKEQEEYVSMKDSIVNIAFIPAQTNKSFKDKAPSEYIEKLTNEELNTAFRTHLIPDYKQSGLMENDLQKFLKYRSEQIVNLIKSFVGEFTTVEKGMLEDESKQVDEFEKTIRGFIHAKLSAIENNYWNNKLPKDFTEKVEERITTWLQKHPHEKREQVDPLDFCQIMDYFKIIRSTWETFEPIFKSRTEIEKHLLHINELRNAVKHTRQLDLPTKKLAEGSLLWFEQVIKG